MKVILKEEVAKLGRPGDLVRVADGYGRNYLIPRGLAVEATTRNVDALERERTKVLQRQAKLKAEADALGRRLSEVSITISHQAGEDDKLFGSVTAAEIAKALAKEGVEVDRRKIVLEEPIRRLGEHTVSVKVHPEVSVNVRVWVVRQ